MKANTQYKIRFTTFIRGWLHKIQKNKEKNTKCPKETGKHKIQKKIQTQNTKYWIQNTKQRVMAQVIFRKAACLQLGLVAQSTNDK